MKTAPKSDSRFDEDANRYAAYLETPEGRLRSDLTLANLKDFLPAPQGIGALSALDLGCGTGAGAVSLARLDIQVTLLDSSAAMLDVAGRASLAAGVADKISLKHGEAAKLPDIFPARTFDIILCHNLLEFVDDPGAVLHGAARVLRNSSAVLSVLVRSQAGEVLKAALLAGDLSAAENNLRSEWGRETLYGGKVRLFTMEALQTMLDDASLTTIARRGVRAIADYLPPEISRTAEYQRIFDLERALGERREFLGVARYLHYLTRSSASALESGE